MDNFKVRCSAIYNIMSEPQSKADKEAGKLGKTSINYVKKWLTELVFKVDKELGTKEVKKGNLMEQEAIELLAEYDRAFYVKNQKHFVDDYMTGTPDIITDDKIIDIKCSWDCFTFPLFDINDELDKSYYWQMQGYMHLTELNKAEVVYVLMNTPDELAYSDLDKVDYNDYPVSYRIKKFYVDRNDEDIEKIKMRVSQVNRYLDMIKNDDQIKKILK